MGSHRRSPVGAQPRRGTTSNGSISSSSSNLSDAVDRRSGISPCSRARLWSPVLALALVVSALTGAVPVALGDPVQFTDQYTPRCTPVAVPPPGGYQRWSSSSTWGGRPIPGVGSQQMVNVTIPCGKRSPSTAMRSHHRLLHAVFSAQASRRETLRSCVLPSGQMNEFSGGSLKPGALVPPFSFPCRPSSAPGRTPSEA